MARSPSRSVRSALVSLASLTALLGAAACGSGARTAEDRAAAMDPSAGCTSCHGDANRTDPAIAPAPPADLAGNTATTAPGVGAHQAHLVAGRIAAPIACTECHDTSGDLHQNGRTDLVWGPRATAGGTVAPQYDAASGTCSNVACHGATLAGGTNTAPAWRQVDGTQAACGTCHGLPPAVTRTGAAHPSSTDCGACHAGFTATTVNVANHVTGVIEVCGAAGCGGECSSCHGLPPATHAVTSPTSGGTADFADCGVCHAGYWYGSLNPATHQNGTADYALAPTSCGICHGAPPPAPHTTSTACESCHAGYTATTVNPVTHMSGYVCLADGCPGGCTSCHGNPPADHAVAPAGSGGTASAGECSACHPGYAPGMVNTATHQNGVNDYALSPTTCTTCHASPPPTTHALSSPVSGGTLTFATCGTCHVGYTATTVNVVQHRNGTIEFAYPAISCTVCHGVPPPYPHPQRIDCGSCHPGYTATTVSPCHDPGAICLDDPTCTSCHGNPPVATHVVGPAGSQGTGNFASCGQCHPATSLSSMGVTATHRNNVEDVALAAASCTVCHAGPPTNTHVRASSTAGGTGNFSTCATCHTGYTSTTVNVTAHRNGVEEITLGASSCNVCHGGSASTTGATPPPVPHAQDPACGSCHVGYTATTVNPTTHRNGAVGPVCNCSCCHAIPSPQTHAVAPPGSGGTGDFTSCGTCHPGYTSSSTVPTHQNGIIDFALGATACTICHGAPPPAPHPARTDCGGCHPGSSPPGVDPWTHRNGIVEVMTPAISATPATLDFGYLARWAGARALAINVANTGGSTLSVRAERCSGTTAEFSVAPAALSVSPGETQYVTVSYDPADTGADTGCVELASDDPAQPIVRVNVAGTSVQPRVPAIRTSPTSLAFGTVTPGSSRSLTLTVSNPGNATLNVSGVARCSGTSDEFRVSTSAFSVSPGSSRQLSVTYRPSGWGTDSGCLAITSNDPARPRLEVPVSGTGGSGR